MITELSLRVECEGAQDIEGVHRGSASGVGMVATIQGSAHVARIDAGGLIEDESVGRANDYEADLAVRRDGVAYLAIGWGQSDVYAARYTP